MNEIIKKNGINFGVIMGVFAVVFTSTIYLVDLSLFTKPWLSVITIVFGIVIGVVLVSKTKKDLGGISFKEAFSVYFLAAVIGGLISTLFNYILFNFIDSSAKETIKELTIKYTTDFMEKLGTPTAAMNEAIQKMAETDNFSIGNLALGFAVSLIFSAIFGLILAAIFKSKNKEVF
jgi:phosphate/sulfate permease